MKLPRAIWASVSEAVYPLLYAANEVSVVGKGGAYFPSALYAGFIAASTAKRIKAHQYGKIRTEK
ncbi:MAG: hypothetical protein QMC77_03145 [Methanocellales archaeon]|nr:hypothetical protein [Methanocellales archaeon]